MRRWKCKRRWASWLRRGQSGQEKKCEHWASLREWKPFPFTSSQLTVRTWFGDHSMAALTMSHARGLGLDRIRGPRKTPEDWREWIYLCLMDKMLAFGIVSMLITDATSSTLSQLHQTTFSPMHGRTTSAEQATHPSLAFAIVIKSC